MGTKMNPELAKQLREAGDGVVQAVVQIRPPGNREAIPSPDAVSSLADEVLRRVELEVGSAPRRTNVLRNVATVVIEADSKFVRALLRQPEVVAAMPNRTEESPFIPPKGKRPA